MYLYLGQSVVVPKRDVIGVFDMDNSTGSRITRDYLARMEKAGAVVDVSGALPKTFVVCQEQGTKRVYLSQLSSATLLKRWSAGSFDTQASEA